MAKIRRFASQEQFEAFYENREHRDAVNLVESATHLCADLTTGCKRVSTAIRRFFTALKDIDEFKCWEEGISESVENGYMSDYESVWNAEKGRSEATGNWAYGVEANDDGFYIFLNVRRNNPFDCMNREEMEYAQVQ